jgi:hypothetical protein
MTLVTTEEIQDIQKVINYIRKKPDNDRLACTIRYEGFFEFARRPYLGGRIPYIVDEVNKRLGKAISWLYETT